MNQSPDPDEALKLYGSRFLTEEAPDKEFPTDGMSALDAMRLVDEELVLEGDRGATSPPSSPPGWSRRRSG